MNYCRRRRNHAPGYNFGFELACILIISALGGIGLLVKEMTLAFPHVSAGVWVTLGMGIAIMAILIPAIKIANKHERQRVRQRVRQRR